MDDPLAVAAAGLSAAAFVTYLCNRRTRPNGTTWGTSAVLASVNLYYYLGSAPSYLAAAQFMVSACLCTFTFAWLLFHCRLERPRASDWHLMALAFTALSVVVFLGDGPLWSGSTLSGETARDITVHGTTFLAFLPTFRTVRREPLCEAPLPWLLWACACLCTIQNNLMYPDDTGGILLPAQLFIQSVAIGSCCLRSDRQLA